MTTVAIGVNVHAEPRNLRNTIESLRAHTKLPFSLLLLPDGPDAETISALAELKQYPQFGTQQANGTAACFNRLARNTEADVIVLLESGVLVGPDWLQCILGVLDSDPAYGLSGPSTNRAWNEQRVFPNGGGGSDDIARTAQEAVRRYGNTHRKLEPLYSLGDFCYVVRRAVVGAIGDADELYGLGPCWEMDYNIRASRAGFSGVWACASYVYRSPLTRRCLLEEGARRDASKRRYQDKFCGLRLSGQKKDYRSHCRGDACPNFAPLKPGAAGVIQVKLGPSMPAPLPIILPLKLESRVTSAIHETHETLVSCIMPTSDRRQFVPDAIQYFLRQDYSERELIIVDDGRDPVRDLVPDDARVRYIRMDRKATLGEKRNLACKEARGEIILHWDDDDWMANHRIRYQVSSLKQSDADMCGLDTLLFHEPASGRSWRYVCGVRTRSWAAGGTLCYWKSFWKSNPFPPLYVGEDTRFVWSSRSNKLLVLPEYSFYVAIIHDRNTSPKRTNDVQWQPYPTASIQSLLGKDRATHTEQGSALVSCIMPTRDRPAYVPHAISYFQRQNCLNKELIIVDDGDRPIDSLLPADDRIRYVRLRTRHTLGAKRNIAVQNARGEYIVHWDDDDWYAAHRLSSQMRALQQGQADVTALAMRTVLELPANHYWKCRPELHMRIHHRDLCCGTIAYPRSLWEKYGPYAPVNCGEDVRFLASLGKGVRVERLADEDMFVCVRHGQNTWRIAPDWVREPRSWENISTPEFMPAEDQSRYTALAENAMCPIGKA